MSTIVVLGGGVGALMPKHGIRFQKYYLRKIKQGKVEPFWEKYAMRLMGVQKLKGAI